jgi:hypothetical protein
MKPGELTAQGVLFLRAAPYFSRTSAGAEQYTMPMLERRGTGVQHITCIWSGAEARSFVQANAGALRAGKALSVTLRKLFCHNNELHAVIYTASLAPDRWEQRPESADAADAADQTAKPEEAAA